MFAKQIQLSPSTKFVLKVLQSNGWISQKKIVQETMLPSRTVKYAIKRLREENVIQEKPNLDDLRGKYYSLMKRVVVINNVSRASPRP